MKTVATLGSHCALQLLKGAKDEGFNTLLVCKAGREKLYGRFRFIDRLVVVKEFKDVVSDDLLSTLADADSVLIPHGTLISEVGIGLIEERLKIPIFGNRWMLRWEADRGLKEKLMREAGMELPRSFKSPEEIDRLCIVKLPGAEGGKGYFLASNQKEFDDAFDGLVKSGVVEPSMREHLFIQEYILGVPVYLQYFYSPLNDELELLGIDRRYETTVDSLGRIPAHHQGRLQPTYIVVGNIPLVLRESLLEAVYEMGELFVKASKKLVRPGIIGPFCIEGVYDEQANFVPFEFSARIVAGTNLYVDGSPYSVLSYQEPMSMGRRIARELKLGLESDRLNELLT